MSYMRGKLGLIVVATALVGVAIKKSKPFAKKVGEKLVKFGEELQREDPTPPPVVKDDATVAETPAAEPSATVKEPAKMKPDAESSEAEAPAKSGEPTPKPAPKKKAPAAKKPATAKPKEKKASTGTA